MISFVPSTALDGRSALVKRAWFPSGNPCFQNVKDRRAGRARQERATRPPREADAARRRTGRRSRTGEASSRVHRRACARRGPVVLRKEVIQPQVLLRLPCYDLVPIIELTFGAFLPCGLDRRLRVLPTFVA